MIGADDPGQLHHGQLQQLMSRFATGIDSCDWAMYRSAFTDDIDVDYSSWRSESRGRWRADDWVQRGGRVFPGLTATRHALSNLVARTDRDAMVIRVNVCADHVLVADGTTAVFTLNGFYDDRCVRADNGWRITGKRLVVQWCTGDPVVLERARERVAAGVPDLRTAG
jgi:3-phenylpropionate/cinnamic acid dioxygenase small subunit